MELLTSSMKKLHITKYDHDPFLWEEPVREVAVDTTEMAVDSASDSGSHSESNPQPKPACQCHIGASCQPANQDHCKNVMADITEESQDSINDLTANVLRMQVGEDLGSMSNDERKNTFGCKPRNSIMNQSKVRPKSRRMRRRLAKRMKTQYKTLNMTPEKAEQYLNETCYIQVT